MHAARIKVRGRIAPAINQDREGKNQQGRAALLLGVIIGLAVICFGSTF